MLLPVFLAFFCFPLALAVDTVLASLSRTPTLSCSPAFEVAAKCRDGSAAVCRVESRPASVVAATWPVASEVRSSSDFVLRSGYTCSLPFFFFFCFLVAARAAVGSSGALVATE